MAFIDRFEKGVVYETSPTYHNLPLVLRVPAVPDRVALDAALATVVGRHEALRTNLVFAADDSVRQRVCAEREVRAEWLPATEPGDGLIGWLRTPFDLEHDSLFRVAVQPLEDGTAWLALLGHQAVVDRVSLAVVAEELLDGTVGEPSSYRDWLAGADPDVVATDLAVQAAVLGGEIEPIALPEREARAAVHVYQERSVPVVLPAGLDAAAARLAVPVDALLLAAFHAVLAAYTGQYELVIGTVQSRRGPGEERVVGPLANLVPVRLNSAPEQDFGSFATVAAGDLARAARHCRAQFDDLVRVLNPAKDMSRTALFDVLFHYAPEPPRPDESGWVGGYGRYDFQLLLRPDGDGVSGRIVYNGLYFGDDQLTLFAEHYTRVVEQAISDPDTTISGFDLLTDRERHTQLLDWNTSAAYPETTIHNLVAAKAREFPDRVALTAGSQHRTYDELVGNAERIARGLVARGVQPGELVALVLERGVAQVEAILGVIAAGAAYLPIAPANPAERIAFILADSETRWVITDGEGPAGDATVLSIPELIAADHDVALPEVAPDDLAYCIYTSGTTGRPKGALITHRNLVRLVRNDDFPFEVSAADVWTMFHSYSFDFSVWEIFGCLVHGGRLVVVADDVAADPQRFLDLLRRERVTVLNQTPTAFGRLTNLALADGERPLDALRYVMFCGEALAPGKLSGWVRRLPGLRLVNLYGITETTVLTTAHEVTRADIDGDVSNIGMPMPTNTTYLLDRHNPRRLLPVGAIGEIYIGGEGVATGYLKRPELNAERFVPDPFGGGRMFRSGDLARYQPDGTLVYLGRGDFQIKLRGFRIEPGEIESSLRAHPDVADAVVLLHGGSEGKLVAYLRCVAGAPSPAALRAHLGARLPVYMVPAEFHLVERFPLTGNGKLDRRALGELGVQLSGGAARAPETATGRLVAGVFAQLLGIAGPGADDSFFDLGGHSLLATKLVSELAAVTGVRLSLRDLFLRPQVQDLADHLDTLAPALAPAPETAAPDEAGAPVAGTQALIWQAERMDPARPGHSVPLLWRARGELRPDALRVAVATLVERHEILRTAFREHGGQPRQVVTEPWVPDLDVVDVRGAAAVDELVETEARTPFDLESGRLLRVRLLDCDDRDGAGEYLLLVCLHRIVFDEGSVPVFVRELGHAYARALDPTLPELPAPVQYTQAVRRHEELLAGPHGEQGLDHFADHLVGAPAALELCPPPVRPGPHGAVRMAFPADFAAATAELRAGYRVTSHMVTVTAVAALLHRWSGSDDVTFGLPMANREDEERADVLGPCANTVVLRSRYKPGMSFGDLLAAVRESILDATEFQAVPLPTVLDRVKPPPRPGSVPYLDVEVDRVTGAGGAEPFGPATIAAVPLDRARHGTYAGLTVTFTDDGAVLSYRGDRYTEADVRRMADWLGRLLGDASAIAEEPLETALPAAGARQYKDFALAQVARAGDAAGVEHWVRTLAGAPSYPAVTPPLRAAPPGTVPIELSADVLDRLRGVRAEHGVSWFMVAAAGLAALLHRWTGRQDVTFGCPVANREEFADVLGPCLNMVVLRSECTAEMSVRDLLHGMRERVLAAFDHQWVPLDEIVNRLNPERRAGWTPYIDVLLAATTGAEPRTVVGGVELSPVELAHDAGMFGLSVNLEEADGRLRGTVSYRGDRFTAGEVGRIARWLGRFLESVAEVADRPVQTLDLIGEDELAELARFEQGPPVAEVTSIPALVARRVRRAPGRGGAPLRRRCADLPRAGRTRRGGGGRVARACSG